MNLFNNKFIKLIANILFNIASIIILAYTFMDSWTELDKYNTFIHQFTLEVIMLLAFIGILISIVLFIMNFIKAINIEEYTIEKDKMEKDILKEFGDEKNKNEKENYKKY